MLFTITNIDEKLSLVVDDRRRADSGDKLDLSSRRESSYQDANPKPIPNSTTLLTIKYVLTGSKCSP